MAKLIWAPSAIADIKSIAEFISKDSVKAASNQIERFFEKAAILEKFPTLGKTTPEIGNEKYREILSGRYRIIYKIESEELIYILTVHHQSRLLQNNPIIKQSLKKGK